MAINEIETILYVADQKRSRDFYASLLNLEPSLDVPGMTEFQLSDGFKLGLMPEEGIGKILSDKMPNPSLGNGLPRCEIYLKTNEIADYIFRAQKISAKVVSELSPREWGDSVIYFADPDGHIIAFAQTISYE